MKTRLNNSIRCLITGSNGFLGKHLINNLKKRKIEMFFSSSKKNDLRDLNSYEKIFKFSKPDIVFNLAAKVGGILENKLYPADFFYDNIAIIINTFYLSNKYKVKKLINVGAGCGYPLNATEPLKESDMFKGLPQAESKAYSMSKKMIFIANEAYFKQYNLKTNTIIPSNLYGEHDNFHLEKSHVIPALIRKFFEAKHKNKKSVEIWGDGTAKRDFIHADDVAKSLIYLAENYKYIEPVNICSGEQSNIKTVAKYLREISQFQGEIIWKKDMPVGQKSREFSKTKMKKALKKNNIKFIGLYDGLSRTYRWFEENYKSKIIRL